MEECGLGGAISISDNSTFQQILPQPGAAYELAQPSFEKRLDVA